MIKLNWKYVVYLLMFAIPNTILSFGILYIINNSLSGNERFLKNDMVIIFFSIIIYTYLLNIGFQKRLNKFSYKLLYDNEKKLFNQILTTSLQKLERYGSQRFFTVVEDVRFFSMLPTTVTHTVNSLLMLILCLIYIFTLSISSALIVVGLIILVAACYFVVMSSMSKRVETLRGFNEHYYQYVNDVMRGFKELKLNFFRRENLMNKFLVPNRDEAEDLDFEINYVFLSINLISQYGLYFVIAVILFVLPEVGLLSRSDVIAYVVVILFISGPINNLINLQQVYTRLLVANKRITSFLKDFEIDEKKTVEKPTKSFEFTSLEFKQTTFQYEPNNENEENPFALGPIDLKIEKGETLFIIGGNGSGKSTFINVLTGLYQPTGGEIILNQDVHDHMIGPDIKNQIAAVFTNNHIFSHNYDDFELENNGRYHDLLGIMQMDQVVQDDKEASARRGFSKGQSKRMSMIFALLEGKPILVLDEWAADQDPHFRRYFYEELIPRLKEEGKTIIAVTHDDAYFKHADRIVKFDYGRIVKDLKIKDRQVHDINSLWYHSN